MKPKTDNRKQITVLLTYCLLLTAYCLLTTGCEQKSDDIDNAFITGYIYQSRLGSGDSTYVVTDSSYDTLAGQWDYSGYWFYFDCNYVNPVESVQIWVESDIESSIPYNGPDIYGYTDANGYYEIPVYLGHTYCPTGYDYVYSADVQVWYISKSGLYFSWGGGITLKRGGEFRLPTICLEDFGGIIEE